MNKAQAQHSMRKPRNCRMVSNAADGSPWEGWYYVEGRGLDILVRAPNAVTVSVKITVKQMEQALKLIGIATSKNRGTVTK